jgi:hypothetical protein
MPVDVWNIHNQILQEVEGEWGADIPPGIDPEGAVIRDPWDNYSVEIFKQQIMDFRRWMSDTVVYKGHPLIVTEFGILMPEGWWGYDADDVNAFMDATFQFFALTTDPELGDPNDGFRLVQRWAWFSLDNPPHDPSDPQPQMFNGNLFDPYTADITGYGLNYATHTVSFPVPDHVDLNPASLWVQPLGPVGEGETVNRTVGVEIWNLGSQDSGPFEVRLEYTGPVSGQLPRAIPNLPAGSSQWITWELAQLSRGAYDITVSVDPADDVGETTECDNVLESMMVVPADLAYLPLVVR